jgi:hypothetical protein
MNQCKSAKKDKSHVMVGEPLRFPPKEDVVSKHVPSGLISYSSNLPGV